MANIKDNKALMVDLFKGTSKKPGNKPFQIAKVLFSGTGVVSSVFVADNAPALPPVGSYFACDLPLTVDQHGNLSATINEHAKLGKAE